VSDVGSAIGIHEHDGGETSVHVPEDVAMEEPGTRVGGLESEGCTSGTSGGNITFGRVDQVHDIGAVGLDDPEVVTVKMDRVSIIIIVGWEGDVDDLVPWENEGVFSDVEVGSIVSASENLDESRDDGREVRNVVDVPLGLAGGDYQSEGDVDVSSCSGVGDIVNDRNKVGFNELGQDLVDGERGIGLFIGSASIAKNTAGERDVEVRVGSSASTDVGQVDPVVTDGLVGLKDDRVTLASKDIEGGDGVGCDGDAIDFDDSEVVLVDRHGEFTTDGLGDDTETVALAGLDSLDGERHISTIDKAASAVHETRVGDRDETGCNVSVDEAEGGVVPPVSKLDDGGLIIDIVEIDVRVVVIVDNERSTKTIEVLDTELRVIPESAGLVPDERNVIGEARVRGDGASGDEWAPLIERVLRVEEDAIEIHGSTAAHVRVGQLVVDRDLEGIALVSLDQRTGVSPVRDDNASREAIGSEHGVDNIERNRDGLRDR